MKALAIDGAISRLTIAAKNDDKICTTVFDIGMRQSEILVPSIESVLEKVNLSSSELDYITITIGPGSFTGLRLAISAAKAIKRKQRAPRAGFIKFCPKPPNTIFTMMIANTPPRIASQIGKVDGKFNARSKPVTTADKSLIVFFLLAIKLNIKYFSIYY